ncbi:BRO family protein [Kingella negevensis]|uniref:BRO family protein n=1 Tax=Kingella negevensis TaxID=1522312 RepID=UPI0025432F7B|nr:BRO family protein [Kingella negevensis]WII93165.1 BRO family protein [Kingella negevensis]
MNTQISFNADVSVSIISHDNRRWLTAEDVGRCLGFGKGNERDGIIKAYNRHADEFSTEDTCTVKLTVQGQRREIRIFSETGCIKLGFFSNTATAKQFRKWAAKVLSGRMAADQTAQAAQLQALKSAYLHANPDAEKLLRYVQMDLNHVEIGKLLGVSASTVRDRLKKLAQMGLSDYTPNPKMVRAGRLGNAIRRHLAYEAQASLALGD